MSNKTLILCSSPYTVLNASNYALDKNVGTYMNNLKNAAGIARGTGNYDELNNILYAFLYDEDYQYVRDNYAAVMLTSGYGVEMKENPYYDTFGMTKYYLTDRVFEKIKSLIT